MADPMILMEDNELAFLEQHRSARSELGSARLLVSSEPTVLHWNFACRFRGGPRSSRSIVERCQLVFSEWQRSACLKLTPTSRPADLETFLVDRGWQVRARFSHMAWHRSSRRRKASVSVRVCRDEAELQIFSEVQDRAFGGPSLWQKWFHDTNRRNLERGNQRFYFAEIEGRPVGVCLLLSFRRVGGLYAVATLEEERGRGVAAALVARAVDDSRRLGNRLSCLHTETGGSAEAVFQKLGFVQTFESRFYMES